VLAPEYGLSNRAKLKIVEWKIERLRRQRHLMPDLGSNLRKNIYRTDNLVFTLLVLYFSSAVLEVGDGVFEVLSTSGDTHLGGDDFDKVGNKTNE
jgi:hypothetical protein